MKSRRVTYRRHCSYATGSNRIRVVKTPGKLTLLLPFLNSFIGGKLVAHYIKK